MQEWVQSVISKWKKEGVHINGGAFLTDFEAMEKVLEFQFPADFKDFYFAINGFQEQDCQEHMFYFWPLEFLVEEFNRSKDKNFVGFCDYLIASHYIGYRKDKSGIFKMYSIVEDEPIAQTFEEVVTMINSNSKLIY